MSDKEPLKAPFPWFGGKSSITPLVWSRLGDCPNFCDPFFGSGAILLARPHPAQLETVNDIDGLLCNFWRAISHDPEAVAGYADYPVSECDLTARHIWLVNRRADLTVRLEGDPEYFDAKIAGWWVWGICCWIGSGWCSGKGPWQSVDGKMTKTGETGGTWRQLPHLGNAGMGVNRQRVHLGDKGLGVNRQRVHLGPGGNGMQTTKVGDNLYEWFYALSDRLRRVRVCCGNWSRVCGPTPTFKHGLTGVFLDPPYSTEAGRNMGLYATDCGDVAHDVRRWAIANGDNPLLRIALCGYEGEHEMPESWECVAWKTAGGYGSQGNKAGRENSNRERIWFSPYCEKAKQTRLAI